MAVSAAMLLLGCFEWLLSRANKTNPPDEYSAQKNNLESCL